MKAQCRARRGASLRFTYELCQRLPLKTATEPARARQMYLVGVVRQAIRYVVGNPAGDSVAAGHATRRTVDPGEIVEHPHGVDDVVGSAGRGGLAPIGVQYLQPASGQRVVPVERVQLERPLQDVVDCRQELGLQVNRIECRSLVDQIGKPAHAFHLRDLLAGPVALVVMNLHRNAWRSPASQSGEMISSRTTKPSVSSALRWASVSGRGTNPRSSNLLSKVGCSCGLMIPHCTPPRPSRPSLAEVSTVP